TSLPRSTTSTPRRPPNVPRSGPPASELPGLPAPAMWVPPASVTGMHAGSISGRSPGTRIERADAGAEAFGDPHQLGLEDIGTPLSEATFVVVDLETTGSSAREGGI